MMNRDALITALDGFVDDLDEPNLRGFMRRVEASRHHRPRFVKSSLDVEDEPTTEELARAHACAVVMARVKREKASKR